MATQTKADRSEAAKKAAATRKRNEIRDSSRIGGVKATATRQRNDAIEAAKRARQEAGKAVGSLATAAKSVGGVAENAGRSVATRVGIGRRD